MDSTDFEPLLILVDGTGKKQLVQASGKQKARLDFTPLTVGVVQVIAVTAQPGQWGQYTIVIQLSSRQKRPSSYETPGTSLVSG